MVSYLFTSDQRISVLPARITDLAKFFIDGHSTSEILDKSDNNNATTLKFYYNLQGGTQTCIDAAKDPISAIRNFVLKFQFPNTRTKESLDNSLNEKVLLAPFRRVVSVLYQMAVDGGGESSLSLMEILFHFFASKDVYSNPRFPTESIIRRIKILRQQEVDLKAYVSASIRWPQYDRQCRELMTVLTYASKCFRIGGGDLFFSLQSPNYSEDSLFIKTIIEYDKYWYPSNPNDFTLASQEYISYMDTSNTPYSVIEISMIDHPAPKQADAVQVIYFGTPGSGKSHAVEEIVFGQKEFTFRTTFHPDCDYSTFVGAYKPVKKDDSLTYEFVPQVFTDAYVKAWKNPDKIIYLVIEEINRGNCAQIFGDLFQLLDRDPSGKSEYYIKADTDLRNYLERSDVLGKSHDGIKDGMLCLPKNFHILATMNTSDQSLFPMDSAFKRRWAWIYVPIDSSNPDSQFKITIGDKVFKWASFLEKANERIHSLSDSEDKQMGNFFIKSDVDVEAFKSKVMFYLWSEVCKEYEHAGSFFKDRRNNDAEFTFNTLFPTNDVTNGILQGFMEYLGVEEAN